MLPTHLIERAAADRLRHHDPVPLQYGAERGSEPFRKALANFLITGYGVAVSPDELFTVAGASQGLDLLCSVLTEPGDTIFVEEPTYFLALRIFADRNLRVHGLPVDEHGLVVEALEEALKTRRPRLLYTIPTHHNPTSVTMPAERRRRLAELAERNGFTVVADEVYHLLTYEGPAPSPMRSFPATAHVVSLGSFSKILAPGLRLGWIQAAPPLLSRLADTGLLRSGGGVNPFTEGVVRSILDLGLQHEHLGQLRQVYCQRLRTLTAALRDSVVEWADFTDPSGGYFVWLRLRDGGDSARLFEVARGHGVGFQPGIRFSSRGGLRDCLRLSFAYYDGEQLQEAAERLAKAQRSL